MGRVSRTITCVLCGASGLLLALPARSQCEMDKLYAAADGGGSRFGGSVAYSSNTALVGAPHADSAGGLPDAGSVSAFLLVAPAWNQTDLLLPGDVVAGARFGAAVALDFDVAVVGAPGHDALGPEAGAVYIFEREQGAWLPPTRLLSPGGQAGDRFGAAVAVSGSAVLVGAPGQSAGANLSGAAHVFSKGTSGWELEAQLLPTDLPAGAAFGTSVSLVLPRAVVGAPGLDGEDVVSGSAYLFEQVGIASWSLASRLKAPVPQVGDHFGRSVDYFSVAIAVGAPGVDGVGPNSGEAHVFEKQPAGWEPVALLVPSFTAPGDRFGEALSMSHASLLVGAPGHQVGPHPMEGQRTGAAALFQRTFVGEWIASKIVMASDGAAGDSFAGSVSLWDGAVFIGAERDDDFGEDAGTAYVVSLLQPAVWVDLHGGIAGSQGVPDLQASGKLCGGGIVTLTLSGAPPAVPAVLVIGFSDSNLPFKGGVLVPTPDVVAGGLVTDALGGLGLVTPELLGVPSRLAVFIQAWLKDPSAPQGFSASNTMLGLTPG